MVSYTNKNESIWFKSNRISRFLTLLCWVVLFIWLPIERSAARFNFLRTWSMLDLLGGWPYPKKMIKRRWLSRIIIGSQGYPQNATLPGNMALRIGKTNHELNPLMRPFCGVPLEKGCISLVTTCVLLEISPHQLVKMNSFRRICTRNPILKIWQDHKRRENKATTQHNATKTNEGGHPTIVINRMK